MNQTEPVSLRHVLAVLRRRKWTILQTVAIVTAAALMVALRSPTEYHATATLLLGPADAGALGGSGGSESLSPATAAKLIRTQDVAERVRAAVGGNVSAAGLRGRIEAAQADGDFITVTARASDPADAARLANAFADEFVVAREDEADGQLSRAIDALENEMERLPPESPERETLATELSRLRLRVALPNADVAVVEHALAPGEASGPAALREGLIGLGLGFVLGLGLAFLREILDGSVKSADELSRLVPAPQLASVPASAFRRFRLGRSRGGPPVLREAERDTEPYAGLRASLLLFNAERNVKSVVVASPGVQEGKTTVASNLAVALAKLGLGVCVVDADLRRPRIARQFGLDGAAPGLTDLLNGAPLAGVIQEFEVPGAHAATNGSDRASSAHRISVIASGGATSRPAELLGGKAMEEALDVLESRFDMVIIDSPPLLRVSDAIPLMARASGTLLVVRLFHTPRDAVTRALRIVDRVEGGLLGVVATGLPAREMRREGAGPYLVAAPKRSHVA